MYQFRAASGYRQGRDPAAPHNPVAQPPPIISNPANRLGERLALNLHSPPDAVWSAPPLIGGTWRALAPEQAMRVMIRLCAADSNARAICDSHDILALRMRPLIAIRDGLLIEFLARPHAGGRERIGVFVYRPGLFDLLDGASGVLHRINAEGGLVVKEAAQALEYVELFCAAVAGDDGSFYPAPPDFPVVHNPGNPALAQSLELLARPPQAENTPEGWRVDMVLAYGVRMFRSQMLLRPSGMIEMLDDTHIDGVTPAIIEGWADNLRTRTPAPPPSAADDPADAASHDEEAEARDDDVPA
jgi:hypothetical protein